MFDNIKLAVEEVIRMTEYHDKEYCESLQLELDKLETLEERLDDVDKDLAFLNCLEAAGVDNWEGYDMAMEMLEEED